MLLRHLSTAITAIALLGIPAYADFTETFNASGTSATDSRTQVGQVTFAVNTTAKTITVTLTNTNSATIGGISQTLVGVVWEFDNGNTPGTLTLNSSATAASTEDCSSGATTCTSGSAPTGTDFGWSLNAGSGPGGVTVKTPNLFAGGGSGKPDGIVTTNINGSSDGLSNGPHNPYLVGPVTFTITYTGTITSIDAAQLYFGTSGESATGTCTNCTLSTSGGSVPEPTSIVLLGSLLVGIATVSRKFKRA